ncbi:MAG: FAD-dependent oxidoreductase [Polyangiales bacterium]
MFQNRSFSSGGYISLEFACIFRKLGVKVDVVHRGNEILRGFDEGVQLHLFNALVAQGITMHMNASIHELTKTAMSFSAELSSGVTLLADHIVAATGQNRIPASSISTARGSSAHSQRCDQGG